MCGIATIFAYAETAPSIDRMELRSIRDDMKLRGPDGCGEWFSRDDRVAMGHRRLSIIDLSDKAAQPMQNHPHPSATQIGGSAILLGGNPLPEGDGSVSIVFNGEIYNYQELRKNLERKGFVFKSHSDTEVLLHLYQEKGERMLHDLRGMFAFALWDGKKGVMLLARDPYGIKPLYYANDGQTLRAASQVKALLAGGHVSSDPEPAGIVGFFLTGSVPEPFTMYQEIRQVPAGSFVRVDDSGVSRPEYYASISKIFSDAAGTGPEKNGGPVPQICEALSDSIKHHLVSDVPVGAFLSAGIDSGALIGLIHDLGIKNLETVTIAFDEFRGSSYDEAPLAKETSHLYGTRHHTRMFTNAEFKSDLDRFFEAMDQPTIDGVNTYFASKAAREIGLKVALSGLGGDELFGGYQSFQNIPSSVRAFSVPSRIPFLGDVFRHSFSSLNAFSLQPKLGGLMKYGGTCAGAYLLQRGLFMPWELETVLDKDLVMEGMRRLKPLEHIQQTIEPDPKNWFGRVASLEASLYMRNQLLRDADWSGMAHSLEIRTPFVDFQLLKDLAPILVRGTGPQKKGPVPKKFLTESLRKPLPKAVLDRPKSGFFTPIGAWMETDSDHDSWRKIPSLAKKDCPWARRWAYTVMEVQNEQRVLAN